MILTDERISNLIEQYGDAFYVLDSEAFRTNFIELKEAFSGYYDNFNLSYSYKTNYVPRFCSIVNELGGYAETVSEMEVQLALKVGVAPIDIIWNGPYKNPSKMEEYLMLGVCVNIDSIYEAKLIAKIAEQHRDVVLNVGIRCNFDVGDGVISRFGIDTESNEFKETIKLVKSIPNVHLLSLQCHFAKRQIEYWPARAEGMIKVIDSIGMIPERIDLGGGLFGKMEEDLRKQFTCEIPDYEKYAKEVASVIADRFADCDVKPELILEPGSALVGDCMKFVGCVKSIKCVRGKYFATVLASQKNISMTGVNPPISIVHRGESSTSYTNLDLVGYTCIEGDCLYKGYSGDLAVGDAVVISNCGSYSVVMKPPFILPNFAIVEVTEDSDKIVKKSETFDDIFESYIWE